MPGKKPHLSYPIIVLLAKLKSFLLLFQVPTPQPAFKQMGETPSSSSPNLQSAVRITLDISEVISLSPLNTQTGLAPRFKMKKQNGNKCQV